MNDSTTAEFFISTLSVLTPQERSFKIKLLLRNFCISENTKLIGFALDNGADITKGLEYACKYGKIKAASFLLEKGAPNINSSSLVACKNGHFDIVKLLLEKGANKINEIFAKSCKKNHLEIAEFLSDKNSANLDSLIEWACKKGKVNIVQLLINKVTNVDKVFSDMCCNIDSFLEKKWDSTPVCKSSKSEIISIFKLLMDKTTDINRGFRIICSDKNHWQKSIFKIGELFMDKITNFEEAFLLTCENGGSRCGYSLAKLLVDKVANHNEGFIKACQKTNTDTVKLLINLVTNHNEGFVEACKTNNNYDTVDTIKLLLDRVTNHNEGFIAACKMNNTHAIELLMDKVTNHNTGFIAAYEMKNVDTMILLLDRSLNFSSETLTLDKDIREYLCQNILNNRTYGSLNNQNKNYLKIHIGAIIEISDVLIMDVHSFAFLLMHPDTIICLQRKYFTIKNYILLCLLAHKYIEPISHSTSADDLTSTKTLSPEEAIDLYLELPPDIKNNLIDLMQDYLRGSLWKPLNHNIFPEADKYIIYYFMLAINKFSVDILKCKIPKPLLFKIINYAIIKEKSVR